MTIEKELQALLEGELRNNCPILSGNMSMFIFKKDTDDGVPLIFIEAPFYDMNRFNKEGVIIRTGATIKGVKNYANWVNESGAFFKHNKSEHWVNRVVNSCCKIVANLYNGEIVGGLPE